VFNLQGSEIVFILLIALVVLGPEKLPDAVRRFTKTYAELKKMGSGFQSELKSALDEPMKQMQETASLMQDAADLGSLDASEAPGAETTEPETASEAPGAETTEPETASEAPGAETEPTQPEPTQPETTEPETTEPEPTQPETTEPETTEPAPTQPGTPEHASSASPMNSIAAANSSASIASRSDRLRARAADDGAGAATSGEPQPDAGTTDVVDVVDGQGVETPAEASSERLATQELSDGAART
jgi:sec-independent protein translocase protein TatB